MGQYQPDEMSNGPLHDPGFSADTQLASDTPEFAAHVHSGDQNLDENLNQDFDQDQESNQEHNSHRKKKKNPFQKRIDQLVYEKGSVEQNNAFLAQQLAEKESYLAQQQARIQEYEEQLNQKNQHANEYFENNLETQTHVLKEKLRQAKENDDLDAEIEIIEQLAELKSTRTTHEAWKIQEEVRKRQQLANETYEPYETPVIDPYQIQQPVSAADLEFNEWVSENPWYQQSPQLRAEADNVAVELSKILNFNNRSDLIGTAEFREKVTSIMSEKYRLGDSEQSQQQYADPYAPKQMHDPYTPKRPAQSSMSRTAVAPVQRGAMAQDYMNSRGHQPMGAALSKDEYELARHLPRGSTESEVDLVRRYQKAKNYPKSPLSGGSPHRLTIL